MRRRTFLAASAASLALPAIAQAQKQRVLKFIPQSDLAVVDPIWTTAYVTRNHAYMVFDTLYGQTGYKSGFKITPQMVCRPRHRGRRQNLEADTARRPAVPQQRNGAGPRLRCLDQALGRARRLRFNAPDLETQKKIGVAIQTEAFQSVRNYPLGLGQLPTAFRADIAGVPEGFPIFWGVHPVWTPWGRCIA